MHRLITPRPRAVLYSRAQWWKRREAGHPWSPPPSGAPAAHAPIHTGQVVSDANRVAAAAFQQQQQQAIKKQRIHQQALYQQHAEKLRSADEALQAEQTARGRTESELTRMHDRNEELQCLLQIPLSERLAYLEGAYSDKGGGSRELATRHDQLRKIREANSAREAETAKAEQLDREIREKRAALAAARKAVKPTPWWVVALTSAGSAAGCVRPHSDTVTHCSSLHTGLVGAF
eukprot:COSAG06_NODE_310_length_17775_cov_9.971374_17_plen_233_part_00